MSRAEISERQYHGLDVRAEIYTQRSRVWHRRACFLCAAAIDHVEIAYNAASDQILSLTSTTDDTGARRLYAPAKHSCDRYRKFVRWTREFSWHEQETRDAMRRTWASKFPTIETGHAVIPALPAGLPS